MLYSDLIRQLRLALLMICLFPGTKAFSQLQFIENKGQWDKKIYYEAKVGNGSIFLLDKGFTIVQHDVSAINARHHVLHNSSINDVVNAHAYNVEFINSRIPDLLPENLQTTYNNYFIGDDQS